jgi:hypothetical protein
MPVLIGPDEARKYVTDQKATIEKLVPLVRDLSR